MHKCRKFGRECATCPWVKEGRTAIATNSKFKKEITSHLTCKSRNVIYLIECSKCNQQYIGETDRTLHERFSEHKSYVNSKKLNQATGSQFNLPGHSVSDMNIMAIQKIHQRGTPYRKEYEKEEIANFNSYHKGINRSAGGWQLQIATLKILFIFIFLLSIEKST